MTPSSVGLTAGRAKGRSHLGTRSPLGRFIGERRGQEERTIVASEPTLIDGLPGSANLCRNGMLFDLVVEDVAQEAMLEEVKFEGANCIDNNGKKDLEVCGSQGSSLSTGVVGRELVIG